MVVEPLGRDRPKRVDAHVQRDVGPADAAGRERREQVGREVQPRRRRRRRAGRPGEHGLIAFEITVLLVAAADVARQRHPADPGKHLLGRPRHRRPHEPRAAEAAAHELERDALGSGAIDERHRLADRGPPAGVRENLPQPCRLIHPQKEPFPPAARGRAAADEPGRHDACVVHDDEIARCEDVGQVADPAVLERAGGPMHHEQSCRRAIGERLLGDQFGGQVVVVKIRVGHAANVAGARGRVRACSRSRAFMPPCCRPR